MKDPAVATAAEIAAAVQARQTTASAVVAATLSRIGAFDRTVNAFTDVTAARARAAASALDARIAAGDPGGPLAGVPFAVKNLFDIEGHPTLAGSKINRTRAAAAGDAALIHRLEAAGAILVGALNMGEYAYDFTGENAHDGASRNPHALGHMSGGSSGGSGAAVAAGFVPVALGSDTNGSIRVPSAFCGVFGLKPTYGRLTRSGTFPFVGSLDHLGPLARTVPDLACAYDAMQGPAEDDPAAAERPLEPVSALLDTGGTLRVAVADGYFARGGDPDAFRAVEEVARALGCTRRLEWPEAARGRAAAFVITAAEGAALHLERLRQRPQDFDPAVRDRLIAGALVPAAWVQSAQRFRRWYRAAVLKLFEDVDVVLAPATPCRALTTGQRTITLNGAVVHARSNIGIFTQPISFIGLPVVCVPVWLDDGLPLGVQVIAAPWREDHALRVARALEVAGAARSGVASLAAAERQPASVP